MVRVGLNVKFCEQVNHGVFTWLFYFQSLTSKPVKTDFKKWHIMKIKDNQIGLYVMLGCVWR